MSLHCLATAIIRLYLLIDVQFFFQSVHSLMTKTRLTHFEPNNEMSESSCNCKERSFTSQKKWSKCQSINHLADSFTSDQLPKGGDSVTQIPCETVSGLCLSVGYSEKSVINTSQLVNLEVENIMQANESCKFCNSSPVEHSDILPNVAKVKIKDECLQHTNIEPPIIGDTASDTVSSDHHKPLTDAQNEEKSDLMEATQMLANDLEVTTECLCKKKEDSIADHVSCNDLESIYCREVFEDSLTSHSIVKPLDYFLKLKSVMEKIDGTS